MARLTIPKRHHIIQQYCYTLFYTARKTLPKRHGVIRSPAEDEAHDKNRSKLEENHQDFLYSSHTWWYFLSHTVCYCNTFPSCFCHSEHNKLIMLIYVLLKIQVQTKSGQPLNMNIECFSLDFAVIILHCTSNLCKTIHIVVHN